MVKFLIQQSLSNYSAFRELKRMRKKHSPNVSVAGLPQIGKSTFVSEMAYELNPKWDMKRNTCLSIDQFIEITSKTKNDVIVIEETANQLNKANWYDKDVKDTFFTLISQAYRRNVYIFCQPHIGDVAKSTRSFVNFQFVIEKRNDDKRACFIKPQQVKRMYWDIKNKGFYVLMNAPMLPFYYVYSEENLVRNKKYTDWIEESFKDDKIMTDLRRKRGLIPEKPDAPTPPIIIKKQ